MIVPLLAVEAVVIDTETTGLDPRSARLVQIGAIVVRCGRIDPASEFSVLVDPGIAVPAASTEIHGIRTADLAGAPQPAEAIAALLEFVAGRPIIGHAIAYDLAVINAELGRAGRQPFRPAFLDTRLLAEVAAPTLPDFTIETLGAWLGIDVEGRHSAIGDARTTGRLFCALLPALRERGVRTWAEADRACRLLRPEPMPLGADPTDDSRQGSAERAGVLARIDPYPYRHRVADVMRSPPVMVDGALPVSEAVRVMARKRISSVFVSGGAETAS